jgi:cytochrome c oxidase subunit 1/cytochrome c oxidase subunit I+III
LLVNVAKSLRSGRLAGPNPWDAPTLEWSVPSPPPPYNFDVIPHIASRHPLWEDRLDESEARSSLTEGYLLDHGRETIGTTPMDGDIDLILKMPEDSYAPLVLSVAISAFFVALLLHWWWLAGAGGFAIIGAIVLWLWPEHDLGQTADAGHD